MKNEKLDQVSTRHSRPGFSTRHTATSSYSRLFDQPEGDQIYSNSTRQTGGANWQNH